MLPFICCLFHSLEVLIVPYFVQCSEVFSMQDIVSCQQQTNVGHFLPKHDFFFFLLFKGFFQIVHIFILICLLQYEF